MSVYLTEN